MKIFFFKKKASIYNEFNTSGFVIMPVTSLRFLNNLKKSNKFLIDESQFNLNNKNS